MLRTYNGRFPSPTEPRSGAPWLVAGLLAIPLWSIPLLGLPIMAGSICCYVKAGKMNGKRRMYRRFHEICTVIGMRERVPIRELAKVSQLGRNEMARYLQKMIAEGYFGPEASLDLNREELVLPLPAGQKAAEQPRESGGWREIVFELLDAIRGERSRDESKTAAPESRPEPAPAQPEEQPAGETRREAKTGTQKTYMDELEKTLNELYQLNVRIQDEAVSQRIDRIGALTGGIFRAVIDKPEREQDVRKFMNYYLPTTLKLLNSYSMLESQSYQGENIVASRKKIESVLDMLIEAYEKQLDKLFTNDALDIATDIDVLETMMAGDGLSAKGQLHL